MTFIDGPIDPSARRGERYVARPARPAVLLAARAGLWIAVVVGCLTGLVALARTTGSDGTPATGSATDAADLPAPVGNVAEMAVAAWLNASGDEDRLDQLFVDPPSIADMNTTNLHVVAVGAVAGQRLDDGYWTVTVAADVLDSSPGTVAETDAEGDGEPKPQTWYVELGIVGDVAHGLAALTTPAVMPAPPPVSEEWRRSGDNLRTPQQNDPVVDAVQGFLEALLTGSGDPSRYTSPGLEIAAVDPSPFSDVTVVDMALEDLGNGDVRAWANAQAVSPSGARQVVGYEFVLLRRADRWEIVEFWGSPSVVDGPPAETPEEAPAGDATSDEQPDQGASSSTTSLATSEEATVGLLSPEEMPDDGGPVGNP